MKQENSLELLKSEYLKTSATHHLKSRGWGELEKRINLLEPEIRKKTYWKGFSFAFASLLILFVGLFGAYKISLAALPGDTLYPVKVLGEKIIQKTTGSNQTAIDNRANEIIGLSKKENTDQKELQSVVSQYVDSVEKTKTQIEQTGQEDAQFQGRLEVQHREFEKINHSDAKIRAEVKRAEDVSDFHQKYGHD